MRLSTAACLWILLVGPSCRILSPCQGGSFHGTIRDAETAKPIEGAVVAVFWDRRFFVAMDGGYSFQNAMETLTDADGHFAIDNCPGRNWNFLNPTLYPEFIAFAVGYGPYPQLQITPRASADLETPGREFLSGITIEMVKLPPDKAKAFTSKSAFGIGPEVPAEHLPLLMRLVNEQAIRVGIPPIPEDAKRTPPR